MDFVSIYHYMPTNKILLPKVARTEAGFYLEVNPVRVSNLDDADGIRHGLKVLWSGEMEIVPTPKRSEYQPVSKTASVVAAKARSYTDFVRNVRTWHLQKLGDGRYQIHEMVSSPGQNHFVAADSTLVTFEAETSTDEIFERLIQIIRTPSHESD